MMQENDNPIGIKKRYRSHNGNPRPYRDGERWKAPAHVILPDGTKEKVTGSGKTRKDAEASRDRLANNRRSVIRVANKDISRLTAFCQHWLDYVKASNIRYKTRLGYQAAIDIWITPHLGTIKVRELRREQIQRLYGSMTASGCSYSSINQVRTVLNQSLKEAIASGVITINPTASVQMPMKKKSAPIFFNEGELERIREAAIALNQLPKWALALYLGLRQGERLGLRWSDINFEAENSFLTINNSLMRVTGQGLVLVAPKSQSSNRRIPLPIEIVELLTEQRKNYVQLKLKAGTSWNDGDFVFCTDLGMPIDPSNDRKDWKQLLIRAKVPYKRLHAARHTTATLMSGRGVDLVTLRDLLGHASISTTAGFYTHGQDHKLREAITKLANNS